MLELFVLLALGLIILWIVFHVLKKIWPFLRFGIFFCLAFLGFGFWFILKEASVLGTLLGVVAVFVGAYQYAKNRTG